VDGTTWVDWTVCFALYVIRMFAVTGGYHRYFAHRTYKTSRWFQFLLAFLAQSSSQKGALWWAAHHRNHHKYSDLPWDVHSPIQKGFWYSHLLWLVDSGTEHTDYSKIKDFAKYPSSCGSTTTGWPRPSRSAWPCGGCSAGPGCSSASS
jgi:stearoyl-CoA desaturase (delta-9 desaturase)